MNDKKTIIQEIFNFKFLTFIQFLINNFLISKHLII